MAEDPELIARLEARAKLPAYRLRIFCRLPHEQAMQALMKKIADVLYEADFLAVLTGQAIGSDDAPEPDKRSLIERLRDPHQGPGHDKWQRPEALYQEAADEIEHLRGELATTHQQLLHTEHAAIQTHADCDRLRAALIAILGALAGALYPAFKAAQRDPIDALAYE